MLDFRSDNTSQASDQIIKSIINANSGSVSSYGEDHYTEELYKNMNKIFDRSVEVFPVFTGSAANILSFACSVPPYGAIFCAENSHVDIDECNGPEFYTGGAKIVSIKSDNGKLNPEDLSDKIKNFSPHGFHNPLPVAITLTQSTEVGTVYTPNEIMEISKIAKSYNMILHLDGARISNALAYLGCSWADISWKAGVDLLSLGTTKNGTIAAEAIILFHMGLSDKLEYFRKRGGHLVSKMRFLSAQLNAFISDDLWKQNALHANNMAIRLVDGIKEIRAIQLAYPVESNGVFLKLPKSIAEGLIERGFKFYPWGGQNSNIYRFMFSFNTPENSVDNLVNALKLVSSDYVINNY